MPAGSSLPECAQKPENDFKFAYIGNAQVPLDMEYMTMKELRYTCTHFSFYIAKGLFDRFGKWDDVIPDPKHPNDPMLVWNDKTLFSDDDQKYTLVAHGRETEKQTYTAIIILDEKRKEVLPRAADKQNKFLAYFAAIIRDNKESNKAFLAAYMKELGTGN